MNSIRSRLVLSYVLISLLAVLLVGLLALTLLGQYILTQTEERLQANAQAIAQQAAPLMDPYPQLRDLTELVQTISFLGNVRVRILDAETRMMIDSGPPGQFSTLVWLQPDPNNQDQPAFIVPLSPDQPDRAHPERWLRDYPNRRPSIIVRIDEGPWGRYMVFEAVPVNPQQAEAPPTATPSSTPVSGITGPDQPQNQSIASVQSPIGNPAHPLGYVQIESGLNTGEQVLSAMRRALSLAGLGAVIIAILAGLWTSRSLTAPIRSLAESATRMSSGDLTARAPVQGAAETAQLARQFNHMAERLQASFDALSAERDTLRRFIADASHELRTPITALGSFIELLQGPAATDESARVEFLSESQIQVKRMEWITANLLDLSRLDAGLVRFDRQPLDLGELIQSAAAPYGRIAAEKGLHLTVSLPQPALPVVCDRARMEMALSNLLHNAVKFTPPGGRIEIRGFEQMGTACIAVQDSGVGIEGQELPHIFERFFRGKGTREGSGLGLSIVQSIVQAHGGQIRVESQPGQGSQFTICIPEPNPTAAARPGGETI